jgi:transcription initiation factor TFIID subunit 6
MSRLIKDAISVQRHSKRARLHETSSDNEDRPLIRRRLHAGDINMALQLAGSEKLYATTIVPPDPEDATRKVSLADFLRTSADHMPAPPSEVVYHMRWLAVDGVQPYNPAPKKSMAHAVLDQEETSSSLKVTQLQSSLLSEELQLYFSRTTIALERGGATASARQQQDAVLQSVARDPGLQELVPFLVRYCQQELYRYIGSNSEHCRTMVRLAAALLSNPQLHLELHLHELLPSLMTCVVAKKLPGEFHWALRRQAAETLLQACNMFGVEYVTLKARVLRALCDAVVGTAPVAGRNGSSSTCGNLSFLPSRYGGTIAITLFGSRSIDSFLLPSILSAWDEWEACLELSMPPLKMIEISMCQQASLDALSVFLRRVDATEKAARLDRQDLEDIVGDRLIALEGDANEYATCFV